MVMLRKEGYCAYWLHCVLRASKNRGMELLDEQQVVHKRYRSISTLATVNCTTRCTDIFANAVGNFGILIDRSYESVSGKSLEYARPSPTQNHGRTL